MNKSLSIPLHTLILLGMLAGVCVGIFIPYFTNGNIFLQLYIIPLGNIFLKLLQLIAIPIILTSLITGIARTNDMKQLGKIGMKTLFIFLCTAAIATTIGVLIADILQPGKKIKNSIKTEMLSNYKISDEDITKKINTPSVSALQIFDNMVPGNIFQSASSNQNMIQIVLFAIFFGISLSRINPTKSKPVVDFLEGSNEVFIEMVKIIMHFAPIGVFALVASVIAQTAGNNLSYTLHILSALLYYCFCVLIGLSVMLLLVYPLIIHILSGISYTKFFTAMRPAFLLAFTSGSSNATLPLTMQCVEENLRVNKNISGFVLPLGTTINMDGTALYQCVAAIFIAQFFNIELSILQQITIILTATLGATGAAGIPGAGMITLTMVLQSAGIPLAGINLILIPDRFLDMCRTVVNVAGDATTCLAVQGKKTNL